MEIHEIQEILDLISCSNINAESKSQIKVDTLKEKAKIITTEISNLISDKMNHLVNVVSKIDQRVKDYEFVKMSIEGVCKRLI